MTLRTPFAVYGWFTAALAFRLALRATASGGFGDDNGVGFGRRLQPGGQVRCFADHSLFPGGTRFDQIADHRQSSSETDPLCNGVRRDRDEPAAHTEVRLTHRWRKPD